MSISPWDELQELAADKYVARELDVSEWRLAEGDGYPLSSNRNRFEFLMWAQIRAIIEQVAALTAERDALKAAIRRYSEEIGCGCEPGNGYYTPEGVREWLDEPVVCILCASLRGDA